MMNNVIKKKYSDKAIFYGNMWLYFIKTAKDVIADCQKNITFRV